MDKPDEGEIIALAAKVGLTAGDLNKYPTELSGGMAKRVAFLRLLLCGCDLALLDEPFVGLDRDLRDILVAMLVEKIERQGICRPTSERARSKWKEKISVRNLFVSRNSLLK